MIELILLLVLMGGLSTMRYVIQKQIQALVLLAGGDSYHGILTYSLIFLPGIMVHELSHFFTAAILGVRTGDISIFPRRDTEHEGRIALGSVKVAKTDFVRGSLIGAAPFFVGTIVLFVLVEVLVTPLNGHLAFDSLSGIVQVVRAYFADPRNWLGLYLVFAVANTMFVSKEDARAFPVIGVFLVIIVGTLLFSGQAQRVAEVVWPVIERGAIVLVGSFMAAVLVDIVVAVGLLILVKFLEKATKKRVVYGR